MSGTKYTVGDLKEVLSNYGDHLPLNIVIDLGDGVEKRYEEFEANDYNYAGRSVLEFLVEDM